MREICRIGRITGSVRFISGRSSVRRGGTEIGDSDAEDIAESVSIGICLEGKNAGTPDEARVKFLTRTKYAVINMFERRNLEMSFEDTSSAEAHRGNNHTNEQPEGDVARDFYHRVKPNQIEVTYVHECLRYLDKLPANHRRVMRKLARGDTPLEIALAEHAKLEDVLKEIKVARDWVIDHERWGEGALE